MDIWSVGCHVVDSLVVCAKWGSASRHASASPSSHMWPERAHEARSLLRRARSRQARLRDPSETELSAVLLSFIECEAKQEDRTAVSSQTQREADEE